VIYFFYFYIIKLLSIARSKKRLTKPKVSSKGNPVKLGWGQTNRNINTLRKIEKANQDEDEFKKPQ